MKLYYRLLILHFALFYGALSFALDIEARDLNTGEIVELREISKLDIGLSITYFDYQIGQVRYAAIQDITVIQNMVSLIVLDHISGQLRELYIENFK